MKQMTVIAILFTGLIAWAQSGSDDPNMNIGLNNGAQTEASFNDVTRASQSANAHYGVGDNATCPNCATPVSLEGVVEDGGVVLSGDGSAVKGTSEDTKVQQ